MKNKKLPDAIHAELLASVFATLAPPFIMSALFAVVGGLIALEMKDRVLAYVYGLGLLATAARIFVMVVYRWRFPDGCPDGATARRIEREFTFSYLAFALPLGLFASRVGWIGPERLATLTDVLIVGYAAGVSTGVATRPRVGVAAMLLAITPLIIASAGRGDADGLALAATLSLLLTGGIRSTLVRYHSTVADIKRRHALAGMARTDPLTGLPNRLALDEHLAHVAASGRGAIICYLDLDGFKPVNDHYGHPAGDAVLSQFAERLRSQLWDGDFIARVGGDEFVLVRNAIGNQLEREVTGRRLLRTLSKPFLIGDVAVTLGASIGCSLLSPHGDPRHALGIADEELYRSKRLRPEPRMQVA